jgi:hypothetical protein
MRRVVFSRKGMDSRYGGMPSPYVPGEPLVSFPIPSTGKRGDGSDADPHRYADLRAGDETLKRRIRDLAWGRGRDRLPSSGGVGPVWTCHHDPDLDREARPRLPGWRPSLGQLGQAQAHLKREGVGDGDVFLFFGWFRAAERVEGGRLRYVPGARSVHALFGWLEIGEVVHTRGRGDELPAWLRDHPHALPKRIDEPTNALYVARERLTLDGRLPGAGVFRADAVDPDDSRLVLTAPGRSRSWWRLPPDLFRGRRFTYHGDHRWQGELLKTAAIGQEFVVEADDAVRAWVVETIRAGVGG